MNDRTRLIAKLHVAKKQLALDDETYRDVLERVTGKRSAKDLDLHQLVAVLAAFRERGWSDRQVRSAKPHVRKVWALWGELKREKIVTATDERKALRAFVLRLTDVADPEWLTAQQATTVIESLKQWQRRARAERAESAKSGDNDAKATPE